MGKSNITISLFSAFLILSVSVVTIPDVYAQVTDEIVSLTVDIQTILLEPGEVIPLFNTNNIANMSKVTVSATLPCTINDVPKLKVIAGVLGNTTDVIDSSSDYANLDGPFDTCLFEDTVDIDTAAVPALNRVFLKNDGTDSVLTNLGTTVTLTGISETTSASSPLPIISIESPPDSSTVFDFQTIVFNGTALDLKDGNISAFIQWSSDIDGSLGNGSFISSTLTTGTHSITAQVTNSDNVTVQDSITVVSSSTPTFEFDYSSSTGWQQTGSTVTITGGVVDLVNAYGLPEQGVAYDLGNTLNNQFVVDFDFDYHARVGDANHFLMWISEADKTASNNPFVSNNDAIGIFAQWSGVWGAFTYDGSSENDSGSASGMTMTTGNLYHMRGIFDLDAKTVTIEQYTTADRITLNSSYTWNYSQNITANLDTIGHHGYSGESSSKTIDGQIDNTKIWDGATNGT